MWPDLCEILPLWKFLGLILNLLWPKFYAIGQVFDAVNVEQIVSSSGHTDPQPTTSRSKVNVIKIVFELNLNFFLLGGVHFDSLFRFKIKVDLHFDVLKKKLKKM